MTSVDSATEPRTAKGKLTRARIVGTAAQLFSTHGVARTSLQDVAIAADVGKSQLYHYFDDKAGLVGSVIVRQTDAVIAAQEPALSQLDTWEGWQQWRDALVAAHHAASVPGGCPLGSLASELADVDEVARELLIASFDRWEGRFRAGLEQLAASGQLRPEADPAALASFMMSTVQGALLLCRLRRSVDALEVALDTSLAHLRSFAA